MTSRVRVSSYAVSIDGFGAGPDQSLENPLGVGGPGLHEWFYPTKTFRRNIGQTGGIGGVDDDFAARGMSNLGAWILGRNMFAHSRGPWPEDDDWKGWWGDEPPYHCPVYVLTHHPRPSFEMKGGTVFHFETGGIEAALDKARAAAGDKDIRIGGGAATIRQYLQAGLIDEMHVVVSPVLLGAGEPLWTGLDLKALGYEVAASMPGDKATHLTIVRAGAA